MIGSPTARLVLSAPDAVTRARLRYAFSAYAALYGIRVVDGPTADVTVAHGPDAEAESDVTLAAGYQPRPIDTPAPPPQWVDDMPSFHRAPSGQPDLLGEVFEWLAAPHEAACTQLDRVGRVPPEHTLAGTHRLDRRVPWANRWLARLHTAVRAALPRLPADPPSPFGPGNTFVASHDLDHLAGNPLRNGARVLKNVGIATVSDHDPRPGVRILGAAARRLRPAPADRDGRGGPAGRRGRAGGAGQLHGGRRVDPPPRSWLPARRSVRAGHAAPDRRARPRAGVARQLPEPGPSPAAGPGVPAAGRGGLPGDRRAAALAAAPGRRAVRRAGAGRRRVGLHAGPPGRRSATATGRRSRSCPTIWRASGHGRSWRFRSWSWNGRCARLRPTRRRGPRSPSTCCARRATDGWGGTAVLWHDYAMTGTTLAAGLADAYWAVLDAGDRWLPAADVAAAARDRWAAAGADVSTPGARRAG